MKPYQSLRSTRESDGKKQVLTKSLMVRTDLRMRSERITEASLCSLPLPICLSVYQFFCLWISASVCHSLSISFSVSVSVCVSHSLSLSVSLSLSLYLCQSFSLPLSISLSLSLCLCQPFSPPSPTLSLCQSLSLSLTLTSQRNSINRS